MKSCEVGIVGAGIHGACVAFHLGRAGVATTVFERETPASGPTGRSSAVCRSGYTNPFLAAIARESVEMLRGLEELTGGGSAAFEPSGIVYLHRPQDAAGIPAFAAQLNALGVRVELIEAARLAADFPELAIAEGELAVWEPDAGYADPWSTTLAFADAAVRSGVELRQHAEVTTIAARAGGGAEVTTADGERTECERLLVCAGPWTLPLVRQLGVELPLTVERHVVATFAWGAAARIPYVIGDVGGSYYLKPEGTEQFGLGTLLSEPEVDPDDYQQEVGEGEALALAEPAIRRVPALAESSFAGGWGSLYDVSPDWQPVIGEIADGVFVSAGTSGHGFKLAPALARHVAGLVSGGERDAALDQFTPARFRTGATLAAGFGEARILG